MPPREQNSCLLSRAFVSSLAWHNSGLTSQLSSGIISVQAFSREETGDHQRLIKSQESLSTTESALANLSKYIRQ